MKLEKNILLSDHTTIGLGGRAAYFVNCGDSECIVEALIYSRQNNKRAVIFSGGSNVIFPDKGIEGLVIKVDNKGIKFREDKNHLHAEVEAGEEWDSFVKSVIEEGYSGIECLSGIPGSAGATPVQNVGAYGQEVSDTIVSVSAINKETLEEVFFDNTECNFGYRNSRFKNADKDKYIITKVYFSFQKDRQPEIKYAELNNIIERDPVYTKMFDIKDKLNLIRTKVLELRGSKSMIINKNDINSRSCGSFFLNPVLSESEFLDFKTRNKDLAEVPAYQSGNEFKLSSAWLVEKAGYHKGYRKGGAGISSNHSLALINLNGTTSELLTLASDIQTSVYEKFGIKLIMEPVIIEP